MKVSVVVHRLGPYHCARLAAAARRCDLTAIELASETKEYGWSKVVNSNGYGRITLFPEGDSRDAATSQVEHRVRGALSKCQPDAVAIPGWSDSGAFAALRWCAKSKTPAILMSESTSHDEPRVWWKEWVKWRIVGLYSTALVGGTRHADYLAQLGLPRDRIFSGYDVVDNGYFARGAKEARGQRTEVRGQKTEVGGQRTSAFAKGFGATREKYGLPENYFLASARFIAKKNLFTLLRAYATYHSSLVTCHLSPWSLVLLGDGPLKADLCRLISDLGLQDSVLLPGFKQYDELPTYYGLAKAFVHASTTEQWGLVVNEAMASGLPVIVSNRCGCAPELVRDGVNGFTFDPLNQQELTARLLAMSSMSEAERDAFGEASQEIIAEHDVGRFAVGLRSAAELAISSPRKRASFVDRALLWALMRK